MEIFAAFNNSFDLQPILWSALTVAFLVGMGGFAFWYYANQNNKKG